MPVMHAPKRGAGRRPPAAAIADAARTPEDIAARTPRYRVARPFSRARCCKRHASRLYRAHAMDSVFRFTVFSSTVAALARRRYSACLFMSRPRQVMMSSRRLCRAFVRENVRIILFADFSPSEVMLWLCRRRQLAIPSLFTSQRYRRISRQR
jgi:hypothetical protein